MIVHGIFYVLLYTMNPLNIESQCGFTQICPYIAIHLAANLPPTLSYETYTHIPDVYPAGFIVVML
jgi:hypothetical protein